MIKKLFCKINSFGQWTKKWHFFHILLWFSFIIGVLFVLLGHDNNPIIAFWEFLTTAVVLGTSLATVIYVILPITILVMLISFIKNKNLYVQRHFILNNPIYNFFYITYYIIIIIYVPLILMVEEMRIIWLAPLYNWGWLY